MRSLRSLGLVALYVGSQLVALALALPFRAQGLVTSANPSSPTAPLYLIAIIVAAPVGILLVARLRGGLAALRWVILVGIGGSLVFTLSATTAVLWPGWFFFPPTEVGWAFVPAQLIAMLATTLLFEALLLEPQWFVVDLVGFVAAGALIAFFGINFALLPTFILLGVLAVYDAIAVYGTKHMVSLAEVVTELKLPILMVMPSRSGYDYTQGRGYVEQRRRPVEEREAMFMGLGDVVFPGILVVSAFVWLPTSPVLAGLGVNLWVSLGTLAGSLAGYGALMRLVASGNPQAGLPFLNGGAFAGYLLAYLLCLHNLSFGLSLGF